MNKEKLKDSIGGLFSYDTGCADSGIHDEVLRQKVIKELKQMSENDFRIFMNE